MCISAPFGLLTPFVVLVLPNKLVSAKSQTADNKRLSEMAVGVETGSLLLPMTLCGNSRCGAPRPPLRQAAGRYLTYALGAVEMVLTIVRELYVTTS